MKVTSQQGADRLRSPQAAVLRNPAARAQRTAWLVIGFAFVLWCTLTAFAVLGVRTFLLTAANPQNALLEIGHGVVFYQDTLSSVQARASSGMGLSEGTVVEAGELTEAELRLFEGSSVHLFPGAQVRLDALRVGRFSDTASNVAVSQRHGAVRYQVAGGLPNGAGLTVVTPHGEVSLQHGEYLVWVRGDGTSVSAYSGKGNVRVGSRAERFRFGQRLEARADGSLDGPGPLDQNLLVNGTFPHDLDGWEPVDVQEKGRRDVAGVREWTSLLLNGDLVKGLRVWRDTAKDTHNETGVVQHVQRDVLPYRNLYIRAWIRVELASLSGGGYAGSEYPIMLQVEYVDSTGGRPSWSHGFYYANPENRPVINAEQVQQGIWIRYEGNLVELKDRPAFIDSVRVIGSGHDFDAMVTQVELIAE